MKTKTILCYGDSNTWGYEGKSRTRYPKDIRWTGRLADMMGPNYEVIEEGLPGRTSGFLDEAKPYTDGAAYFLPCILSHNPVDYIIFMLGTNDIKPKYDVGAREIARSISRMLSLARQGISHTGNPAKIMLVAPVPVTPLVIQDEEYDHSSVEKSGQLVEELERVGRSLDVRVYRASDAVGQLDSDGCHWTPEGHRNFASAIAPLVREDLSNVPV